MTPKISPPEYNLSAMGSRRVFIQCTMLKVIEDNGLAIKGFLDVLIDALFMTKILLITIVCN